MGQNLQPSEVMKILVKAYGPQIGMRLFGLMIYLTTEDDLELLNRTRKVLWQDVNMIKGAGLAPDDMNPSRLGKWTKYLNKMGLRIGLASARVISPKAQPLGYKATPSELLAAREVAKDFGVEDLTIRPEDISSAQGTAAPGRVTESL